MKLLPVHNDHLRKTKRLTGSVEKRKRENVVLGEEKATGLLHFWLRYAIFEVSVFRLCRLSASLLQLQDTRTMHTKNKMVIKKEAKVGDSVSVPE